MRSVLTLALLIALSASAAARGDIIPDHDKSLFVTARLCPGGVPIYRDGSVPGGLRTDHDDPPAYDDPSKFGGG
jgi:hypothetical protein